MVSKHQNIKGSILWLFHQSCMKFAKVSSCPSALLKGFIDCSVTSNDLPSPTRWVRVLESVIGCIREL